MVEIRFFKLKEVCAKNDNGRCNNVVGPYSEDCNIKKCPLIHPDFREDKEEPRGFKLTFEKED